MKDVYCPYCGYGVEVDDPDGYYYDTRDEYTCPECGKIFILFGEVIVNYSATSAEKYYKNGIESSEIIIDLYEKLAEKEPENEKWLKSMIKDCHLKDLERTKENLARVTEHNRKVEENGI